MGAARPGPFAGGGGLAPARGTGYRRGLAAKAALACSLAAVLAVTLSHAPGVAPAAKRWIGPPLLGLSCLFLVAGALVIDLGGPLSHGAIAARELGIPCVINTRHGTARLRTGDLVVVDGEAGTVRPASDTIEES